LRWGASAEEVETRALVRDGLDGEDGPEGVAKRMAHRELGEVGDELVVDRLVVHGDHELGKEGGWRPHSACEADIVAAKGGVATAFFLEGKSEHRLNGGPLVSNGRLAVEKRVIAGDHERGGTNGVLEMQHSNVVVSVVVVCARFTGEPHAG